MKQLKDKLFLKDWMQLQPYFVPTSSDNYFLDLANKMLGTILDIAKGEFLSLQTKRSIALSVAAYFQDIISDFGLWRAFTGKHFSMYGKYLPFYDLPKEYEPREINPEDVCFIIWTHIQLEANIKRNTFINPENPMILMLGLALFEVINEEYETAPESETLSVYLTRIIDFDDIYSFREALAWLFYSSYLISPFTEGKLEEQKETLEKYKKNYSKSQLDTFAYSTKYEVALTTPCGPLALRAHEWMASIVGEKSKTGKMLLQTKLRFKMPKSYLIESEDEKTFTLIPFDSDKPIKFQKHSLQETLPVTPGKDAVLCNLIFYNGEWQLCGFITNISKESYQKNKEDFEKNKLNKEHTIRIFEEAYPNQKIIYSLDSDELLSNLERIFPNITKNDLKQFDEESYLITFADEEYGLTTMADLALFIKDKNNPCYDKTEAKEYGFAIFIRYEIPQHIIEYLIKNKLLPDIKINSLKGEGRGKELVQKNLDFLFRFFQPLSFS